MIIELTPEHWAHAAMLGEARRRTNEKSRSSKRDRGHQKNVAVDLIGSLGELIALEHFETELGSETLQAIRQHMLVSGSGRTVKGADLSVNNRNLDVKTFDCAPNKRFFAINSVKHRQLQGQCDGYFALLSPQYGRKALVVECVPYQDVDQWPCKALGSYGDPSFNCPIREFLKTYTVHGAYQKILNAGSFERREIRSEIQDQETQLSFRNLFPQSVSLLKKAS